MEDRSAAVIVQVAQPEAEEQVEEQVGRKEVEGLWWEIDETLSRVPPDRILLFFPRPFPENLQSSYWRRSFVFASPLTFWLAKGPLHAMRAEQEERYSKFRQAVVARFRKKLPDALRNVSFVCFDARWHSIPLPPSQPGFLRQVLSGRFPGWPWFEPKEELRPFVEKLTKGPTTR